MTVGRVDICSCFAHETEPHGGTLDAAWPCIPVAHLAYETDTSFSTIHCLRG